MQREQQQRYSGARPTKNVLREYMKIYGSTFLHVPGPFVACARATERERETADAVCCSTLYLAGALCCTQHPQYQALINKMVKKWANVVCICDITVYCLLTLLFEVRTSCVFNISSCCAVPMPMPMPLPTWNVGKCALCTFYTYLKWNYLWFTKQSIYDQ